MKFTLKRKRVTFCGKQGNNDTTVNSHRIDWILKKSHQGYLLQLKKEESVTDKTNLVLEPPLLELYDIFTKQKGLPP